MFSFWLLHCTALCVVRHRVFVAPALAVSVSKCFAFFFFFSVPVPLFWKVLNWPADSIINPLEWPFVPVCMPCIDQVHRSQRSWQAECLLLYLFYLDIDVCIEVTICQLH